ncbi:MAG: DUF3667 domain-containing protein [Haliscomenobacter sp.]|nr:DUF3667 domain-containing protein [Haliscomenobacter sp.]MCF8317535.1 DUF3667 domain-containing protein [Haliscomenobacter sp.]
MNSNKEVVDCPNCGVSFSPSDKFCTNCGQKASLPGLSLISIIKEYIDIVFNFEYRLWISFFHLFIPGKLSTQFFDGKRQKYLSPLRIFLIFGLIHFALFGNWVNKKFDKQLTSFENYIQENAFREQFINNIDSLPNNIFIKEGLDTTLAIAVKEKIIQRLKFKSAPSDSLFNKFNEDEPISISTKWKDSLSVDSLPGSFQIFVIENIQGKWTLKSMPLSFTEVYNPDPEHIIKKANVRTDFGKWQVKQEIKLQKEIKNFTFFVTGQLIWMVIFSMLLISLFQRVIYFRLPFYYAHHLIHNLHFHAFSFLVMSLFMMGNNNEIILKNFHFFILVILFYQLFAIKNIFRQRWLKTIFKVLIIDGIYLVLSASILLITVIISMLMF